MATAIKKCKVCEKEYEYCHTSKRIPGVFRWQDVACCPEHGSIYFSKIEASRAKAFNKNTNAENCDDLALYECEDEWFEDDFDDESGATMIN